MRTRPTRARPVANDLARAERVLDLVPSVSTSVWGRDELRTGDMWNSNSLISWLFLGARGADLPAIMRSSPGWDAGLVVARDAPRPSR
jgi:hypothetical protein